MSDVTTKLVWNGGLQFTGTNAKGFETVFDGNTQAAASPVEILLEALGACSAIDVVLVLEKSRQPATRIEVTLAGNRHSPEPRYFTEANLRFDIWGDDIKPAAVARAIQLSLTKYCSVYHSLRADLKVTPEYRIHAATAEADGAYQLVETSIPTGDLAE